MNRYLLTYYLAFFRAITLKRLSNFLLLKITYYYSALTRKASYKGMPASISIEPTTSCNLQCPECPSGLRKFTRATGALSADTFNRIVQQLGEKLIYVTFYFQGEPLLHRSFSDFIKQLSHKKIVTATSTNAHFLTKTKAVQIIESGLDRLIVSVDGADAETYLKYRRGGNFYQVVENIQQFMEIRKSMKSTKPFVEMQFIVFKHNEHQISEMKSLAKTIGVDKLAIKTAQIYEFEKGSPLMPGLVKYSRYRESSEGVFTLKGNLPNRCYRSWSGSVITWDGNVVPCCFDKDATHQFGNIMKTEYKKILQNPDYLKFRQQILTDRSQIEICRNCTEGL
ncbi:MAG: SPASM domain-containing protein [Bacteroidales bacterium]|nr:SPASM domain-containing protein [Bacteroidales bacterium]